MRHEGTRAALEARELLFLVVLPLAGGAVVGLGVLGKIQWHGLRWTWMLAGIPVTWLLTFLDASVALGCAVATATTICFGMLFSLAALHRGGEAARRVREEIGPLHLAFALVAIWRQEPFDPFVLPVNSSDLDQ